MPRAFRKKSPSSFFMAELVLDTEDTGMSQPDRVQPSDEAETDSEQKHGNTRLFFLHGTSSPFFLGRAQLALFHKLRPRLL